MNTKHNDKAATREAANLIRVRSTVQLKRDFNNCTVDSEGKYYDQRVYTDSNGVEHYPYMFSKTLEHDSVTGFPKKEDVDKILDAVDQGTVASLDVIPQAPDSVRKLEGVLASSSFNLMGTDSSIFIPPSFHHVDTEEGSFEMAEVYGKALCRDTPFSEYNVSGNAADNVMTSLNEYSTKTTAPVGQDDNINAQTLFRGPSQDETVGPYVSQLLLLPFSYGNIDIEQKFSPESDYAASVNKSEWKDIQDGKVNGSVVKTDAKYVYNGRVLGAKVHNDPLYQFYYNATLICLQNSIGPSGFSHPRSTAWTSGGGPNVLAAVAHVCLGALRCAWYSKFNVGMKIRPEVYAQRLELANDASFTDMVEGLNEMNNLMKTSMKDLVKAHNGNDSLYLMLQFPEGSPTHPAWCAGHAAVSGAAVTVMKAMLDCHDSDDETKKQWPVDPKQSDNTGDNLEDYTEADASNMTIVGELNKLASNVALGRDFAGVHYRCDGDCGVALGEKYAITYLVDLAKELHESQSGLFTGWLLEKFNGDRVRITSHGVQAL